jgi:hypothetical protein
VIGESESHRQAFSSRRDRWNRLSEIFSLQIRVHPRESAVRFAFPIPAIFSDETITHPGDPRHCL